MISTRCELCRPEVIHNGEVNYGKLLGWGIVIYAIIALAWSGLALYGLSGTLAARLLELVVLIVVATLAGRSLRLHSWTDILPYSLFWAVEAAVLDIVYNVPSAGWGMYSDWNLWLGYALVVIVPLLAPKTRMTTEARRDF